MVGRDRLKESRAETVLDGGGAVRILSTAGFAAPEISHFTFRNGVADDNVHPQNTMQLLTTFATLGKDVDLRIYPPGHHGAAFNASSYMLINQVSYDFLTKWMRQASANEPVKP